MVNSVRFRLAACPGRESGSIGGNYRDALHVIIPADVTPQQRPFGCHQRRQSQQYCDARHPLIIPFAPIFAIAASRPPLPGR